MDFFFHSNKTQNNWSLICVAQLSHIVEEYSNYKPYPHEKFTIMEANNHDDDDDDDNLFLQIQIVWIVSLWCLVDWMIHILCK